LARVLKKFAIRLAAGAVALVALGQPSKAHPASASGYCITYRHWVGWADYYGVPWTYSDFFDDPYIYRCRDAYIYAAPRGAYVKKPMLHHVAHHIADRPLHKP